MKRAFVLSCLLTWVPAIAWATEAYDFANAAFDALNTVKEATSSPVDDIAKLGPIDAMNMGQQTYVRGINLVVCVSSARPENTALTVQIIRWIR